MYTTCYVTERVLQRASDTETQDLQCFVRDIVSDDAVMQ